MKRKSFKRYIPKSIQTFINNKIHLHIKWNKDLSSSIYELDKEGLIVTVDTVLRVSSSRELNKEGFVEIPKEYFHKILHNDYTIYLDYLIEEKVIICDNKYEAGTKAKGYKINIDFYSDITSIEMSNNLLISRSIKAINQTDTKLKVSTKHRINFIKDFKIDYEAAYNYMLHCFYNKIPDSKGRIMDEYNKMILQRKLMEINDGQLFISRSKSNGRIHTNLTFLNGDYKQFINGYYYSLDIVASQPSLVNILINLVKLINGNMENCGLSISSYSIYLSYVCKILSNILGKEETAKLLEKLKIVKIPSKNEIEKWKNITQKGDVYKHLSDETFVRFGKKISRAEMKVNFMTLAFSPKNLPNEYKNLFKEIYPTINKFFNDLKSLVDIKRQHKILSILLQATESFIWVECILPELDKMNIQYHFIHDSIIIKEKDLDRAYLKIEEQFFKFGLTPQIKVEELKK